MDLIFRSETLRGPLSVIPSKSVAHRALICAAFADGDSFLACPAVNRDMIATMDCLNALGAHITNEPEGFRVRPAREIPRTAQLPCGESGSTLRFLLPIAGALGVNATFLLEGRLPQRPLSPLWEEMERMGCRLTRPSETTLRCEGRLQAGDYRIRGDVSSQFITGLLLAGALIPGTTKITVLGQLQSRPYVTMTLDAMAAFGKPVKDLTLSGDRPFHSPGSLTVEGDWSSAAFFLGANALGSQVTLQNLDENSSQGDRAAAPLMEALRQGKQTISASDIPDLVPILAVAAACLQGAVFTDIQRLRLKESDRVETTCQLIHSLGGKAQADENALEVFPTGLHGGRVDPHNDHRIAMAAAIAATVCREPVILLDAQCAAKSYPQFYEDYSRLGGHYEQYIR